MGWLLLVAFWFLTGLAFFALVKRWNAPPEHWSHEKPAYWLWGESWWRGYRRLLLPAGIGAFSLAIAGTFPSVAVYVGTAGLAFAIPLMLTTFFLNWPKLLVPPAFRNDQGVLVEAWHNRS